MASQKWCVLRQCTRKNLLLQCVAFWLFQRYLLKMGARLFDPFNISALSSIPKTQCRIIVHSQNLTAIHRIPNLLRLKRHLIVTFLMFDSLKQIQLNEASVVFPHAGILVMDMHSLVSCKSGMCFKCSNIIEQSCLLFNEETQKGQHLLSVQPELTSAYMK